MLTLNPDNAFHSLKTLSYFYLFLLLSIDLHTSPKLVSSSKIQRERNSKIDYFLISISVVWTKIYVDIDYNCRFGSNLN